ncbi:hypothetical protein ACPEIC_43650 [Stenotrophomonas sp. NPDC087984]
MADDTIPLDTERGDDPVQVLLVGDIRPIEDDGDRVAAHVP